MIISLQSLPILVVDDDDSIHKTVRKVLLRAGCQPSMAASGQDCLQCVRDGFRGLILMDIMMPGMDGWATIRALKNHGLIPGNLICMMTAIADPGPGNEDLAECVFDYLPKPFNGEQLLDIVRLASNHLIP
jgi:CheY-like chemotaxis protein